MANSGCSLDVKRTYDPNVDRDIVNFMLFDGLTDEAKKEINDTFYDADKIINAIVETEDGSFELPSSFTIADIKELGINVDSSDLAYVGQLEYNKYNIPEGYRDMRKKFVKDMIAKCIFSVDVDPNDPTKYTTTSIKRNRIDKNTGVNALNINIFNYKLQLIKDIADFTGETFDTEFLSTEQFTRLVASALASFESKGGIDISNPTCRKALDAYVTLKTFDYLVDTELDFLKSKLPLGVHSIDMYEYVPPKASQLNNYSDESADIHKTTSKLQKIILSSLPVIKVKRIKKNGNVVMQEYVDTTKTINSLGGESGSDGFANVVGEFKTWIYKQPLSDPEIKKFFLKKGNLPLLFDRFIKSIDEINQSTSYIAERARAMRRFIFSEDSNLAKEIKDMFTGQLYKTQKQFYIAYKTKVNDGNKSHVSYNMTEQFVDLQTLNLFDAVIQSYSLYSQDYGSAMWDKLVKKWNITSNGTYDFTIDLDGVTVPVHISKNNNTISSISIDTNELGNNSYRAEVTGNAEKLKKANATAVRFIKDILQIVIPSNYEDYLEQFSAGEENTMLEVFLPIISILYDALNNPSDKGFSPFKYYKWFTPAAEYLNIAFGTSQSSVIKNQEGNNIPSAGLTNMGREEKSIIAILDDQGSTVNDNNPVVKGIRNGDNIVTEVATKQDCTVDGKTIKASRAMGTAETTTVSVMDDFLCKLWAGKGDSGSEKSEPINLQITTTSDKATHPLFGLDANKMVMGGEKKALDVLRDICKYNSNKAEAITAERRIVKDIRDYRRSRVNKQANALIAQFSAVYPDVAKAVTGASTLLEKLQIIDKKIRTFPKDLTEVIALFNSHGFDFVDQIHCTDNWDNSSKEKYTLNETLYKYAETYNDPGNEDGTDKTNTRLARSLFTSIALMSKNDVLIPSKYYEYQMDQLGDKYKAHWIGTKTGTLKICFVDGGNMDIEDLAKQEIESVSFNKDRNLEVKVKGSDEIHTVEVNPVIKAHAYANMLYANGYKDLVLGDCFAHKYKYQPTADDFDEFGMPNENFYRHCEAARESAGFKRAVIVTATIHPFNSDVKYGVSTNVNIACMEDIPGKCWGLTGIAENKLDSMDGSGLASPYQAILENWSLGDAYVGWDKKTIGGDIDPVFGCPRLLKWAVFALTNSRRRLSYGSEVKAEDMFRRMHNKAIDPNILANLDISEYYNLEGQIKSDAYKTITRQKPIYFTAQENDTEILTGKTYKILKVTNEGKNFKRTLIKCDNNGNPINGAQAFTQSKVVSTLYDMDQFFGGCWTKELNDNGKLDYTESTGEVIANVICNNNLKEGFTGYIINKSAMKVGITNMNSKDVWKNPQRELSTFKMKTAFIGVQMDPDHELDLAEVTEMSQMISALIQNGYMTSLVNEIYGAIGSVALEGVKELKENLINGDSSEIARIIGKALMEAFETNTSNMDTLANVFMVKAAEAFKNENSNYKIPFSSGQINGKFISTVVSLINKSGIRRKYQGVAAVLVPSHDMIQYYKVNGRTLTYPELHKKFVETLPASSRTFKNEIGLETLWTVKNLLSTKYLFDANGNVQNPYLKKIDQQDIEIEDTICIREIINNPDGSITYSSPKIDKVDSLRKHIEYRNLLDTGKYEIYNWEIAPKNLRQSNLHLTATSPNGVSRKLSMYDLDSVVACDYLNDAMDMVGDLKNGKIAIDKVNKTNGFERGSYYIILQALDPDARLFIERCLGKLNKQFGTSYSANIHLTKGLLKQLQREFSKLTQIELKNIRDGKNISNQIALESKETKDLLKATLSKVGDKSKFTYETGNSISISNVNFSASEIIMGRLHAKELGLEIGDTLDDVMSKGENFFRERMQKDLDFPSEEQVSKKLYDAIITDKNGKKTLVYLGKPDEFINNTEGKIVSQNNDFYKLGLKWMKGKNTICSIAGVQFKKYVAPNGETYDVMITDSMNAVKELMEQKDSVYDSIDFNYKSTNWKDLLIYQHSEDVDSNLNIRKGKVLSLQTADKTYYISDFNKVLNRAQLKNIEQLKQSYIDAGSSEEDAEKEVSKLRESYLADEMQKILNDNRNFLLDRTLTTQSKLKWEAFQKQLNCIGARIPTQSMQSFMAMKIVGFSDSETNEVYVPKSQTWLQGSDYDIDKLYILCYSLNNNGILQTLSNLQNRIGTENAMSLPTPKGRTFKVGRAVWKRVNQLYINARANDDTPTSYEDAQAISLHGDVEMRSYIRTKADDKGVVWHNNCVSFALGSKPDSYFELIQDVDEVTKLPNGDYSVHFKTASKEALTSDEKDTLFRAVAAAIPVGGRISTWGSLSKGGISGIERFAKLGFEDTKERRQVTLKKSTKENLNWAKEKYNIEYTLETKGKYEGAILQLPVFVKTQSIEAITQDELKKCTGWGDEITDISPITRALNGEDTIYFADNIGTPIIHGKTIDLMEGYSVEERYLSQIESILNIKDSNKRKKAYDTLILSKGLLNDNDKDNILETVDLDKLDGIIDINDIDRRRQLFEEFIENEQPLITWRNLSESDKEDISRKQTFVKMLNQHDQSIKKMSSFKRENALRNEVVDKVLKVTTNPVNQINLYNPINMDIQHESASKSNLGKDELDMLLDCPMTKVIMQIQNMVGKEVIGISAVMLKNFFAASCHVNTQIQNAAKALNDKDFGKVFEILKTIVFQNNFTNGEYQPHLATIANVNFDDLLEALGDIDSITIPGDTPYVEPNIENGMSEYLSGNTFYIRKFITDIKRSADRMDASDSISGLLSAATDNAKELILSKINATSMFADIYGHLLISGIDFASIADFMMSPIMNIVARFSNANMFSPIIGTTNLKNIIEFVLNNNFLGRVNSFELGNIILEWGEVKKNDKWVLNENAFLPKLVYQIDDNNKVKLTDGKPTLRTGDDVIKVDFGEGLVALDETFLKTVYDVQNGELTEKAKNLRAQIFSLLTNNKVIDILTNHIIALKAAQDKLEEADMAKKRALKRFTNEEEFDEDQSEELRAQWEEMKAREAELAAEADGATQADDEEAYRIRQRAKLASEQDPTKIKGVLTSDNYEVYILYLEEFVKKRNKLLNDLNPTDKAKGIKNLNYLYTEVLDATEEQSIHGRMLGANQGLKTNEYDMYAYIKNIENFVNKRYDAYNANDSLASSDKLDKFDLMKFIQDPQERAKQIRQYEKVKSKMNILDDISVVSHFREMFNMTELSKSLIERSARNRLEWKLAEDVLVKPNSKLTRAEFGVVKSYVGDVLTLNWLKSKAIKLHLPKNTKYYKAEIFNELEKVSSSKGLDITLDNAEALATFKYLMDLVIIPGLRDSKQGRDNALLSNLTLSSVKRNGKSRRLYKFMFNPMQANSNPDLSGQWDAIKADFGKIADMSLSEFTDENGEPVFDSEMTIMDALYLYNMLTFNDAFSQNSLIDIFKEVAVTYPNSLLNDYENWLGLLDADDENVNLKNLEYEFGDVLYRLACLGTAEDKIKVEAEKNDAGQVNAIKLINTDKSDTTERTIPINMSMTDDYTIDLPVQLGLTLEEKKEARETYGEASKKKLIRYTLNSASVVNSVINQLNSQFPKVEVYAYRQEDLENAKNGILTLTSNNSSTKKVKINLTPEETEAMLNAKAFISNGKVFVNLDNADVGSPVHEFMHIAAAMLKFNDNVKTRKLYYTLLDKAQSLFKEIYPKEYENLVKAYGDLPAGDFNEELLVRLLECRFVKSMKTQWGLGKDFEDDSTIDDEISKAFSTIFKLSDPGNINISKLTLSKLDNVLAFFNSELVDLQSNNIGIDQVRQSEALISVKKALIENGSLTYENCK